MLFRNSQIRWIPEPHVSYVFQSIGSVKTPGIPGAHLFRVRRASQFPRISYKPLWGVRDSAFVFIYLFGQSQNVCSCFSYMNESYVLVAIILCVWLLVKLLPGMEP